MQGKICMVTGANKGMGKVIAGELAKLQATVVIVSRDPVKGQAALEEIRASSGNPSVELLTADLSSQREIRELADRFQRKYPHLHVLVNNAGAQFQKRKLSVDGIEMNLAVNHMAPFLLTKLLMDRLNAGGRARIVNVASNAMTRSLDLGNLQGEKNYRSLKAYG